ncbi:MAG: sigma-70 family RNA polymerase sigma factor [Saprospiraceae bacterium]|nr:sigma-70 family RNA polymerase sigma factor [Saprospiraceae bacterium]
MKNDLLDRLRANDTSAYKLFYKKAYWAAASFVLKNSGTQTEAQDIFQEAMVVFLTNIRKSNFELTCKPENYIYAIVRNLWLKSLKKSKKTPIKVWEQSLDERLPTHYLDEEDNVDDTDQQLLMVAMKTLSSFEKEDCKQLLTWFYFDRISLKEIAIRLNLAYGSAKNRRISCLKHLKKRIKSNLK